MLTSLLYGKIGNITQPVTVIERMVVNEGVVWGWGGWGGGGSHLLTRRFFGFDSRLNSRFALCKGNAPGLHPRTINRSLRSDMMGYEACFSLSTVHANTETTMWKNLMATI
jgi:hypothetical protein